MIEPFSINKVSLVRLAVMLPIMMSLVSTGVMCELLWSDPQPQVKFSVLHICTRLHELTSQFRSSFQCHSTVTLLYFQNGRSASKRGVAIQFGPDVTNEFCSLNNLGNYLLVYL